MLNKVKEQNLTSLSRFREELCKSPRLTSLFFELTDACNMSCLHCGSNASPQKRRFLDYQSIRKTLEEVAARYNPKQIMVCLTGGEPMLHPQFYQIAATATALGFMCGITTNATMIDDAAARKIKESGICSVAVSIDGTNDTHNRFRNKQGAYQKAMQGIESLMKLADADITVQITTVVHKNNLAELDDIYSAVLQSKVHSWRLINIEPIGRALQHKELLLSPTELRTLLDYIRAKRFSPQTPIHVTYGCSHYLGEEYENELRDHYFMCGAGIFVGSVLCNGDIYACLDIERRAELVQGNIHTDSFTEVWENGFTRFRGDRASLCADCSACAERSFCRGDSAHTWDYVGNKPMLCYKTAITSRT